nr:hypothetical protein [Tanacetum cinerariifolium]
YVVALYDALRRLCCIEPCWYLFAVRTTSSYADNLSNDILWEYLYPYRVITSHVYPNLSVRLAQLVDTKTESEPKETPPEAEESQPLGSRVPLKGEEFEASELSGTRTISSHSSASSDSTTPLSPDHPLTHDSPTLTPTRVLFHRMTTRMAVRTLPTLSPGMSARIAEAAALSPSSFYKRYRSSYETRSPSSSLTLPIWKRYRVTSKLILDAETEDESSDLDTEVEGSEDEGPGSKEEEEEEATPEGQQQAILIVDTIMDEPLGLEYRELRRRELALGEGLVPSTFEVGQRFGSVLEQEGAERKSAFRQHTIVTWVDPADGRVYTDILTYVPPAAPVQTPPSPEWLSGSLPVSPSFLVVPSPIASLVTTQKPHLDALPPTLFEGYDMNLRELYSRSGEVRDEIFSQRYRFRSLEREQEQITKERRERLELTDRIARMERRHESGEE